ncbi:InlB B-repeat-containing protein [Candidatus Saccharibacteria bacterium]|nr:InlB B-repeat-containing protein [Candidatus Saccharibacteria bacterium]
MSLSSLFCRARRQNSLSKSPFRGGVFRRTKKQKQFFCVVFASLVLLACSFLAFLFKDTRDNQSFAYGDVTSGTRLEENSALDYYLTVDYGTFSNPNDASGLVVVTDKIPDGLTFLAFGTEQALGCSNQSTLSKTYDASTRVATIKLTGLSETCTVKYEIKTKTPTLPTTVSRQDFFNTATIANQNGTFFSETVHAYIGDESSSDNYTLNYSYTGDAPVSAKLPASQTIQSGLSVQLPTPAPVDGYVFNGWTTTDATISNNTLVMPTKNLTLEGTWSKADIYKVSYVFDGRAPSSFALPSETNYAPGSIVNLISPLPQSTFDGYRLLSYTVQGATVEGNSATSNGSFVMPSGNVVVKIKFSDPPKTTLTLKSLVQGDLANTSEYFRYIFDFSDGIEGETYALSGLDQGSIRYGNGNISFVNPTTCTYGRICMVYLKHNQQLTLSNISTDTKYTINMSASDASYAVSPVDGSGRVANLFTVVVPQDYTSAVTDQRTAVLDYGSSATDAQASAYKENNQIVATWSKNSTPPTAAFTNIFPFIASGLLAGAVLSFFLFAKKFSWTKLAMSHLKSLRRSRFAPKRIVNPISIASCSKKTSFAANKTRKFIFRLLALSFLAGFGFAATKLVTPSNALPPSFSLKGVVFGTISSSDACTSIANMPSGNHYVVGTTVTIEKTPTCVGADYVFAGWHVVSPTDLTINNDSFIMPSADVTLYPTWEKLTVEKTMQGESWTPRGPTFGGITTMQEMTSAICAAETTPSVSARTTTTTHSTDASLVPTATLLDPRDNKSYTVSKLADGNCWMTQNLDLGDNSTEANPLVLTPQDSNVSQNFTMPAAQTKAGAAWNEGGSSNTTNIKHMYDFSQHATYADRATTYGNLYNWYTATAGTGLATMGSGEEADQSICPKGWQLPSNTGTKSYYNLLTTTYALNGSTGSTTMQNVPFSFPFSGYYYYTGSQYYQGSQGFFWSSTANGTSYAPSLYFGSSNVGPRNFYGHRADGLSVRCVAQ